jgi:hypothetical protein
MSLYYDKHIDDDKTISQLCRRNDAIDLIKSIEGFYSRRGSGSNSYNTLDCNISNELRKTIIKLKEIVDQDKLETTIALTELAKKIKFC